MIGLKGSTEKGFFTQLRPRINRLRITCDYLSKTPKVLKGAKDPPVILVVLNPVEGSRPMAHKSLVPRGIQTSGAVNWYNAS